MDDPTAGHPVISRCGSATQFTALPLAPAVNLRGADAAFHAAATGVIGFDLPVEPNRFEEAGGVTALWLGPDEWLVLGTPENSESLEPRLRIGLDGVRCAITDVTGNRLGYRISGPRARDLLAAGCPLDLHPRAFGPGHCAQTLLARTGIILLQRDEIPTFDMLVRRSFARYFADWLTSVAGLAELP